MDTPPQLPNRRQHDMRLETLSDEVKTLGRKLDEHITAEELELQTNTKLTKEVADNTAGIVEAWKAIEGGLKVLGFLAKLAKWLTAFSALAASLYALFHVADAPKDINPVDLLPKGPPK